MFFEYSTKLLIKVRASYFVMKRLGIVGGLGPVTSSQFFVNVNNAVIVQTKVQPDILMENVPMPEALLQRLACGEMPEAVFTLLSNAVIRLQNSGCELIVIPCNTVHVFIDRLRQISFVPILSIVEELVAECSQNGFSAVGLLASTTITSIGAKALETSDSKPIP